MGPTILFVDDDTEDVQIIREGLDQLGFSQFDFCTDGIAALQHLTTIANKVLPNLVVCDLQLPLFDGLELARALKADSRYKGIPVVIYSGSLTPAIRLKLQEAGVTEMFEKPATVKELKPVLNKLIELATGHHLQL